MNLYKPQLREGSQASRQVSYTEFYHFYTTSEKVILTRNFVL